MLLQFKSCPYTFIQIRDLYALNKVNSHWYYESELFDEHLFYVLITYTVIIMVYILLLLLQVYLRARIV